MALTKRVEVLFNPEEYRLVEELARSRGETVGSLLRRAVQQQYLRPALKERQKAARRIIGQKVDFGEWEDVKAAIQQEVLKQVEAP
ncbi:MAG: hypothetical protein HY683_03660 [Chloroflexi bacterium]|nr:hypothetical protein [Chloroflexota bacterium]